MSRLRPCAACGVHIRRLDLECPFCGHLEAALAPLSRLSVAVLGLALAGCAPDAPQPAPVSQPPTVATPPAPPAPPPITLPPSTPPPSAEDPQPIATTAAPTPNPPIVDPGVDSGATPDPPLITPEPPPKPKYGAPRPIIDEDMEELRRPAKKYGAPPPPDPRPSTKYGGPPPPT